MTVRLRMLVASVILWAAAAASGQTVDLRVSSTEAFVGESLSVQVVVSNMPRNVQPIPPQTPDFAIQPDPSRLVSQFSRTEIINGRVSQSVDYGYFFLVQPLRTGRLVLPPFTVQYNGLVYNTKQIPIVVNKDTSSDYLLCEIKTGAQTAYVGEQVKLSLEIWVRQYQQAGIGKLDANNTWNLRDTQASSLGVFGNADWDQLRYSEVTRNDPDGTPRQYYVYVVDVVVQPTKPGPFDFGNVAIAFIYPKRLTRGFLVDSRRLRVPAKTPPLEIKAVPTEGRPPYFNGTIGRHTITAWAKPTDVPVGDPITLSLAIGGEGPLEQLLPPKLDQVAALTRDFEVSGESLAGEIQGNSKVFSQTVRALREDVKQVPPIPLSYFDTKTGRFETVWTEPIPINVRPAERLAVTTLNEPGSLAAVLAPLVEKTEGLLANETDTAMLLADHSAGLGARAWAIILAMPGLYLVTWFIQWRAARYRNDEALRRRSRAYPVVKKTLKAIEKEGRQVWHRLPAGVFPDAARAGRKRYNTGETPVPQAGQVRAALTEYIADRCNGPPGALTREEAVRLLAERGVPSETVQSVDGFLEALELAEYGGMVGDASRQAVTNALRLVDELQRCRWR